MMIVISVDYLLIMPTHTTHVEGRLLSYANVS